MTRRDELAAGLNILGIEDHTCLDLPDGDLDLKMRALQAQASQTTGLFTAFGESTYRAWISDEFWVARQLRPTALSG